MYMLLFSRCTYDLEIDTSYWLRYQDATSVIISNDCEQHFENVTTWTYSQTFIRLNWTLSVVYVGPCLNWDIQKLIMENSIPSFGSFDLQIKKVSSDFILIVTKSELNSS